MPNVETVRVILPDPIVVRIEVEVVASAIIPLPDRPTTLNEVLVGGATLGLWP